MCEETVFNDARIVRFVGKTFDANSYVLAEEREALIFDAVDSSEMMLRLSAQGIENITVFLTHEHFDHISGLERLRSNFVCRVIASAECSERIQSPKTNLSSIADALISMHDHSEIAKNVSEFSASGADAIFDGDSEFEWHNHKINCHSLKGHSLGSACYILDGDMLFSGDELLSISVITRLPGGSTEKYWVEDMPWFESIKNDILFVFPGHGQPGKIEDMIKVNVMPEKFRRQER